MKHPWPPASHDFPLPWGPRPSSFIPLIPLLLTPAPTALTFLQFFQVPTVSPCQSTALFLSGTFCPHFLSSNLLCLIQDSVSLFRHLFHTPGPFLRLSPPLTSVLHLCMVWLLLCRAPVSPEDGIFLEDEENTLPFRSITVQHNSYCISAPQRRVE